jgi:hypothetical protein
MRPEAPRRKKNLTQFAAVRSRASRFAREAASMLVRRAFRGLGKVARDMLNGMKQREQIL